VHDIFGEGWQWPNEQMIKFWSLSGLQIRIGIRIRIETLIRCALVEVCTVPVLLVKYVVVDTLNFAHILWFVCVCILLFLLHILYYIIHNAKE